MRDLSLHLMDIVQNSITANAGKVRIGIRALKASDTVLLEVEDDGDGMDSELLEKVKDPFATTRTTRKVGLGIPLLSAACTRSGGSLGIDSEKGRGTVLRAKFSISSIDRPPLGDIAETMTGILLTKPEGIFELTLENDTGRFVFSTEEVREKLGKIPITQYEVLDWIKEYIRENTVKIFGGVLNEIIG